MTLSTTHEQQVKNIQKSAKFNQGQAVSFPGYTVISPPWQDEKGNQSFYQTLEDFQSQLVQELEPSLMIAVPSSSFHLTIGDLIWNSNYQEAVANNPQFEVQLSDCIRESFLQYQQTIPKLEPIQFQLLGLTLFTRAVVICLVPQNESSYERLITLRRLIYQNSGLIALGIEQQYHFTAHITLGYFGEGIANFDRERFLKTLANLSDRWLEIDPQILTLNRIELRKFDNMTRYYRESTWPVLAL
jgi:hypothetical protein